MKLNCCEEKRKKGGGRHKGRGRKMLHPFILFFTFPKVSCIFNLKEPFLSCLMRGVLPIVVEKCTFPAGLPDPRKQKWRTQLQGRKPDNLKKVEFNVFCYIKLRSLHNPNTAICSKKSLQNCPPGNSAAISDYISNSLQKKKHTNGKSSLPQQRLKKKLLCTAVAWKYGIPSNVA